jgi:hypothetical protein
MFANTCLHYGVAVRFVNKRSHRDSSKASGFPSHGCKFESSQSFKSDWIEKCLAHENGRSSRGRLQQGRVRSSAPPFIQEWSDIVDARVKGKKRMPVVIQRFDAVA